MIIKNCNLLFLCYSLNIKNIVLSINKKIYNEIIHIVCGIGGDSLWIITAYYPDSKEWEKDMKTRKEKK